MATASPVEKSSISSEGLELLECFVATLDDAVYELAEEIARERTAKAAKSTDVIRIESDDIEHAARIVIGTLKDALQKGRIAADLEPVISSMQKCFESRCAARNAKNQSDLAAPNDPNAK